MTSQLFPTTKTLKHLGVGAVVLLSTLGLTSLPSALPISTTLEQSGWALLTLPGKSSTQFVGRADGVIEVKANNSVSFLYREIPAPSRHKRFFSWRWRVDASTPTTALDRKGRDDRPLAVHLCFSDHASKTGWERFRSSLLANVFGIPVKGKLVTYVWGGFGSRGQRFPNPHFKGDGVIFILRPGNSTTGAWFREKVDVAADFNRAFGYVPSAPSCVAISADADDTGTRSDALIADLQFTDE